MRKSSYIYILGVLGGIFGVFEFLAVSALTSQVTGFLVVLISVSILWTGVFVEGIEDGYVGF